MGEPYNVYIEDGDLRGCYPLIKGAEIIPLNREIIDKSALPAPELMEEIIEVARVLSQSLFHARIDFMKAGDRVVLGEITLSPGAYMHANTPEAEVFRLALLDPNRLPEFLEEGRRVAAKLGWPQEVSFGHLASDPRMTTAGHARLPNG